MEIDKIIWAPIGVLIGASDSDLYTSMPIPLLPLAATSKAWIILQK